jgi:hypothetical protein
MGRDRRSRGGAGRSATRRRRSASRNRRDRAAACTRSPFIPIELLRRDVEWLGKIIPEVIWERTPNRDHAIVTYQWAK